ncbi:hypothetical protein [Pseudoduganella sp. OTU4001]|uniref:hypothetical protein n=1 Tax=Pseudoduganella sp. OTU4001 TaxID=3043854 RepID=UPI00313BD14E
MKTVYTKPQGLSPEEQSLLNLFRSIDTEGRYYVMSAARIQSRYVIERASTHRPALRLVKGGL